LQVSICKGLICKCILFVRFTHKSQTAHSHTTRCNTLQKTMQHTTRHDATYYKDTMQHTTRRNATHYDTLYASYTTTHYNACKQHTQSQTATVEIDTCKSFASSTLPFPLSISVCPTPPPPLASTTPPATPPSPPPPQARSTAASQPPPLSSVLQ